MTRRVMFTYWGRRGSLGRFALQLMEAAEAMPAVEARLSVSRQGDDFDAFRALGDRVLAVDTFSGHAGAILRAARIAAIRRRLAEAVRVHRVEALVNLMPHVWSGAIVPGVAQRAGIPFATVLHDFTPHPGDLRTRAVHRLLMRDVRAADPVVTLSRAVTKRLAGSGLVPPERIRTLFHPDLTFGASTPRRALEPGEPWRLLFLGRIMVYKGLPLLVEALQKLQAAGRRVEIGVYGEGALGREEERLRALGATICNRWQSDAEIAALLPRYHAMVLSHVEASQSGVAAVAFGAGLPVVATPVGGLREQVADGVTGMLAQSVSAEALAAAIERLMADPAAYARVAEAVAARRASRSMAAFVARIVEDVLP